MLRIRTCTLTVLIRAERALQRRYVFYWRGAFYDVLCVNWRAGYVDLESCT